MGPRRIENGARDHKAGPTGCVLAAAATYTAGGPNPHLPQGSRYGRYPTPSYGGGYAPSYAPAGYGLSGYAVGSAPPQHPPDCECRSQPRPGAGKAMCDAYFSAFIPVSTTYTYLFYFLCAVCPRFQFGGMIVFFTFSRVMACFPISPHFPSFPSIVTLLLTRCLSPTYVDTTDGMRGARSFPIQTHPPTKSRNSDGGITFTPPLCCALLNSCLSIFFGWVTRVKFLGLLVTHILIFF